ncbi:hypothetical protein TREMEDRAFT_60684 [Tremella mesenterica DSM 1558]|uniref:uncharacterized protein n=1 Tax=Tremella mesenterica (strain ATCC 24925 / CBS 8224 / DSM 1558 / NBRC 9311 / NRRL Y-6157 / RJB 2259-6 / UBC 559-6) TaxID=578456 RepID=UPI0003F49E39|nr:uncharacterized protein TREMEDRAFT_60684 [Tremella mesenterica DSM 1558]EIW71770.1 hypothetical protein TREMEDRAFT_60684 [Tremella mesenterica DSM 1558]
MNFGQSTRRYSEGDAQSLRVSIPQRSCSAPPRLSRENHVTISPWSPSSSMNVQALHDTFETPSGMNRDSSCVIYETGKGGLSHEERPASLERESHRPAWLKDRRSNLPGEKPVAGILFSGGPPSALSEQSQHETFKQVNPFPVFGLRKDPASTVSR